MPLFFSKSMAKNASAQNHIELNLESKLSLNELMTDKTNKTVKIVGLFLKLLSILTCLSLLTIYESLNYFLRRHFQNENRAIPLTFQSLSTLS